MIDVTINDNPKAEKPFPKVMQITNSDSRDFGALVYFTELGVGTVIKPSNNENRRYDINTQSMSWNMPHFTDYDFGQPAKVEAEFPKLMESSEGEIFYMVRELYGLPLTGKGWSYHQEDFASFNGNGRTFTDFHGSITLKNK